MKSIVEMMGMLQSVLDRLEKNPGECSAIRIAESALRDSECYTDFSLVAERRRRIQEFLHALKSLDKPSEKSNGSEDILASIFPNIRSELTAIDSENLFARIIQEDYRCEMFWDDETGTYKEVVGAGDMIVREGMVGRRWMTLKLLSDILDFYDYNEFAASDLDDVCDVLSSAENLLADHLPEEIRLDMASLYQDVVCFLELQHVSYSGGRCIDYFHVDNRRFQRKTGKYADEHLLDGAMWEPSRKQLGDPDVCWCVRKDGVMIREYGWPGLPMY